MHAKADLIIVLDGNQCLSDDEINNTILEYQQCGGGGNESDDVGEWSGGQSEEGGDEPDE
jgi:hypothetical protein